MGMNGTWMKDSIRSTWKCMIRYTVKCNSNSVECLISNSIQKKFIRTNYKYNTLISFWEVRFF